MAVVEASLIKSSNILTLLGMMIESMTSTPGSLALDITSDSYATAIAYSTVYPVAIVLLVIFVQILGILA